MINIQGEIQGIPSVPKLQTDMDSLGSGLHKVQTDLAHFRDKTNGDIAGEKETVSSREGKRVRKREREKARLRIVSRLIRNSDPLSSPHNPEIDFEIRNRTRNPVGNPRPSKSSTTFAVEAGCSKYCTYPKKSRLCTVESREDTTSVV